MRVNKNNYKSLLRVVSDLAGLEFALTGEDRKTPGQFLLHVTTKEQEPFIYRLTILWAGTGWPSEVRQAIRGAEKPWPRNLIVAARSFSLGALEILRKLNANWLDETGNIRLSVPPSLFILKEAKSKEKTRMSDFAWSSSSISLAEFILSRRIDKIALQELAEKTGWSVPQVSNVFRAFDGLEWTKRRGPPRGRGVWRELVNPGALLDALAEHLVEKRPKRKMGHKLMREPIQFLSDDLRPILNKVGGWAVTGWAGLEIIAPFINMVPAVQVYLPTDQFHRRSSEIFEAAKIRRVEDGGNIEFWEIGESLVVADQEVSDIPVINLPRLYSDLISIGGRAKDGAEHLRETQIGY